jgi:hypothetical protein
MIEFTQRLCDFAESQLGAPYQRPNTVCLALALRALDYAAGRELYAPHADHLKSAASIKRFLGDGGLDGLITYMQVQGFIEIPVTNMQPGDIGFTGGAPFGIGAAICVGRHFLTSHPDTGVMLYPQLDFIRAVRLCR